MDGVHFIGITQLLADSCHLIPVGRNNADALVVLLLKSRKHLLLNHVDLTLVEMSTGMVACGCPVHGQHIRLIVILSHDNQLPMIELLIAEVNDLRMAAVVFTQQRDRCIPPYSQCRRKQAVS